MAQQSKFDFDSFNRLTDRIPTGLQIHLAQQLLSNVVFSLNRFDNELSEDAQSVLNDLKAFRVAYKADSAARAEKKDLMASDGKME